MDPIDFIRSVRSRLRRVLVLEGISRLIVIVVVALAAAVLIDYVWRMPGILRLCGVIAIAVAAVIQFRRRLYRPLHRAMDDRTLAFVVERRIGHLDGRLMSGIEGIALSPNDRSHMQQILNARTTAQLVPAHNLRWYLSAAGALILLVVGTGIFSPGFFHDACNRLFLPLGSYQWGRTSAMDGSLERQVVPVDEPMVVSLNRKRGSPAVVRLSWQNKEASLSEERILDGTTGPWRQALSLAAGHYIIVAESGDASPIKLFGRVVARPQIATISAKLTPPAYIGGDAQELTTLNCTALKGGQLDFAITFAMEADRELQDVGVFLGGERLPITRSANGLIGTLPIDKGGELVVMLRDQDGIGAKPEPKFTITLDEDHAPIVNLDGARNNEAVMAKARIALTVEATDDHGLTAMDLGAEVAPAPKPGSEEAAVAPGPRKVLVEFPEITGKAKTGQFVLQVGSVATAGEKVLLQATATDGNTVSGPGVGKSPVLVLRVVTDEELRHELDRLLQEARDRVSQAREELGRGLNKADQLTPSSRNSLMAARKSDELAAQVVRRWHDNQLPEDQLEPVVKADDLLANQILPDLGRIPAAGAKAQELAKTADANLAEAERLLGSLLQEGDLSRMLSNLLQKERQLRDESHAFVMDYLTKPLDEAGKNTQANLAARQRDLADQMKDVERKLLASQSTQLAAAQDLARKEQPSDRLFQAGAKLASADSRTQAEDHQKAAIATMEKLLDLLRGTDGDRALAAQAGELAAAQEQLVKELEQGTPPGQLTQRQKDLLEQTKKLLEKLQSDSKKAQAAKSAQGATQSQDSASKNMQKGDSQGSTADASAAAAQLREAQRQLEGDDKKDQKQDEDKKKKSADVLALLKKLRTEQTKVVTDSTLMHQKVGEKPLDFAAKRDLAEIADAQSGILLELKSDGIDELKEHVIAAASLQRVADAMQRALTHLETPALGEKGLRLEKVALHELTRLIEIAENLPKPEDNSGGGGGGGGGGRQAPFPPAAELALLAAMQDDIALRTAGGYPGDLAAEQKKLLDLVNGLSASIRPGSRPAVLLDRTGRAMASSAYLLGQKDRGLTTRHEQETAAATIRRMLAELKGSGSSNSQSQSQQKPQQQQQPKNSGEQPGQTQGNSSTAGGNPQSTKPGQSGNAATTVNTEGKYGNLMQLPPERREWLNQPKNQSLLPADQELFHHYLEKLEEKP